jgi:hypothetical protein
MPNLGHYDNNIVLELSLPSQLNYSKSMYLSAVINILAENNGENLDPILSSDKNSSTLTDSTIVAIEINGNKMSEVINGSAPKQVTYKLSTKDKLIIEFTCLTEGRVGFNIELGFFGMVNYTLKGTKSCSSGEYKANGRVVYTVWLILLPVLLLAFGLWGLQKGIKVIKQIQVKEQD